MQIDHSCHIIKYVISAHFYTGGSENKIIYICILKSFKIFNLMFTNIKNVKIDLPQFASPWLTLLISYKDEICQCPNHTGSGTTETNTENKFEKSWHKKTYLCYIISEKKYF